MPTIEPSLAIDGVVIVSPDVNRDPRGSFVESYRRTWFPHGREMVQFNCSEKESGAVVGLHFHLHQADYWSVVRGTARVVLHDLRSGSPTEKETLSFDIDASGRRGVWIPPGVAHGFGSLTDLTMTYLVDQYYNPADELGVAWDDPDIDADWGISSPPVLSRRDQSNPTRAMLSGAGRLPTWGLRT